MSEPGGAPSAGRRIGWRDLRDVRLAIALGFGAGLAPRAPGTAGALVGLALAWAISFLSPALAGAVLAGAFALGVWVSRHAITRTGLADPGLVVWDEVVGMAVAVWGLPADPVIYGAGFALFRLFDIWKPWPVRTLDRKVHGGLGVMLDDVAAGILAGIVLQAALAGWSVLAR